MLVLLPLKLRGSSPQCIPSDVTVGFEFACASSVMCLRVGVIFPNHEEALLNTYQYLRASWLRLSVLNRGSERSIGRKGEKK